MKRISALFLALALLLSLASCGTEHADSADSTSGSPSPPEIGSDADASPPSLNFDEVLLIDNDQCQVKITGIDPDNMWGYALNTYLENRSSDKTYMFSVQSAAVNGVEADPLFAQTVAPGKKSNDTINFMNTTISEDVIGAFTDIELTLKVYDSDDWQSDPVALETAHIYPYGEAAATAYVREPSNNDTILLDNDAVTVVVTGYDPDALFGYTANLYLVNKTDQELTFSVDDASVNGYMADPFWATSVGGGKAKFTSMSWSNSTLEANGITAIESIEMNLRVYNANNWSAEPIFDNSVSLYP